ncbi:MAG: ABC transporter permease [Bacteroidota bacterium]
MLKNYLLVSLRNFRRNKLFSLINLLGLITGICSSWLMLVYIYDELSYDQHFEQHERIVRLKVQAEYENSYADAATIPVGVGPALKKQSPVVERVAAFNKISGQTLVFEKKRYPQEAIYLATEDLFKVLSIPLLEGDPNQVLAQPNSIVLSESTAHLIFGEGASINQVVETPWGSCRVTGIFAELPTQTHFHPNLFISIRTVRGYREYEEIWNENFFYTYAVLQQNTTTEQLSSSLAQIEADYLQPAFDEQNAEVSLDYQSLTDIHLYSDLDSELEANGDILYVYIFAVLAAFMMLIACINYMNLSTAQASERTKEIGVRKVLGAVQAHLSRQFMTEAILLTFIATLISGIAFALILPWFNEIAGKHIGLADMLQVEVLAGLLLSMILVALLCGTYPSVFLSRIHPLQAFRSGGVSWHSSLFLRKGLVIVQFTAAVFTLVSTLVVYRQFSYMMNANLGFEGEQVLRIRLKRGESLQFAAAITNQIRQLAEVEHVGMSNQSPGDQVKRDYFAFETDEGENTQLTQWMTADHELINSLEIPLISGRNIINQDYQTNEEEGERIIDIEGREVLVNESLIDQMGWKIENAIGRTVKILLMDDWEAKVVGVIKDFHFSSLHDKVQPLMIVNFSSANEIILIKLKSQQLRRSLDKITAIYREQVGNANMDYSFLDEHFAAQYQADSKRTQLFIVFTLLTTFIACLGLLGLASFSASRRIKEIGIRKVLGASVPSLLYLLSRDFVKLIMLSLLIAIPLAAYFLINWLEGFAYRTDLSWWVFMTPAGVVLVITILTVSGITLQTARRNPVDTLRYE